MTQVDFVSYYSAMVVATASLTALLFIAISLRPDHFRASPPTYARASATFYCLSGALIVSLANLFPTSAVVTGLAEAACGLTLIGYSVPFTVRGHRAGGSYRVLPRIVTYYCALLTLAVAGILHAAGAASDVVGPLLAVAVLWLLVLGITNAWVLVLSREPALRGARTTDIAS
jgi:hypothetical protein